MAEGDELSPGYVYKKLRSIGIDPILSLKLEIIYWDNYDNINPISSYEMGLILKVENDYNIDYISSLKINNNNNINYTIS